MDPTEIEATVDFIMADADRIRHALLVEAAAVSLRERIVQQFVGRLKARLREHFDEPGWEIRDSLTESPLGIYKGVSVTARRWSKQYGIGISSESKGPARLILCVWRDPRVPDRPPVPDVDGLRSALDAWLSGKGHKETRHCPWYCDLPKRYRDWDLPDTLVSLYEEGRDGEGEILKQVVDQIVGAARTAVPFIDRAFE